MKTDPDPKILQNIVTMAQVCLDLDSDADANDIGKAIAGLYARVEAAEASRKGSKDEVTEALEKVMDLSGYGCSIPSDKELLEKIEKWKATDHRLRPHVHEWRSYLDQIVDVWEKLTPRERAIYFTVCELQSAREEWE